MDTKVLINQVKMELNHYDVISDDLVKRLIAQFVKNDAEFNRLSLKQKTELCQMVFNAIRRLDILQPLLEDDSISEIMVNGLDSIFVEKRGRLCKLNKCFDSLQTLETLIQRIVAAVNRSVNTASPIVDARLADGSRVNIVLPPVAINGPIITIRKFREDNYSLHDLVALQSLPLEIAEFLIEAVKSRKNIFISGGTGSGKTTFLNALSSHIPHNQRVISIEDSAELRLFELENWVRLETRNANAEGAGKIVIKDLIKTALRMRPDRIIVGEVRGEEAIDMLQAMNTGHDGSLSTGHANSINDMLTRLETMVFTAQDIPLESIKRQIGAAIDIIVHLAREPSGQRRVVEIKALIDYQEGDYHFDSIYQYQVEPCL